MRASLLLAVAVVPALLGCKACDRVRTELEEGATSEGYWSHACVTQDRSLLAVSGDGWAGIDLGSGTVLRKADAKLTNGVHCDRSRATVHEVSGTVDLPSGARGPESEAWRQTVWVSPIGPRVRLERSADRKGRATSYLSLHIATPVGPERELELGPGLFGAIGSARSGGPAQWTSAPMGFLPDGRLVVLAGWTPSSDVSPIHWAFFAVDLAGMTVSQHGIARANTVARHLGSGFDALDVSKDGRSFLVTFRSNKAVELAIYDPEKVDPRWSEWLSPVGLTRATLSPAADRLFVASEMNGPASYQLQLVDIATRRRVYQRTFDEHVIIADFLADGSFFHATAKRNVECFSPDGSPRWKLEPKGRAELRLERSL